MKAINTLEDLTGEACTKAMAACVHNLRRLRWSDDDILHHSSELLSRLRAAVKSVLDEAVSDFTKAMEAGMTRQATTCFYIPFIAAGIKVASEFDQDQADEFWSDYSRQSAVE